MDIREQDPRNNSPSSVVGRGLRLSLLTCVLVALILVRRRYVAVTVAGRSMEPAHRDGDVVLVRRTGPQNIRPGQVIVVAYPDSETAVPGDPPWLMKRVSAVPGDRVAPGLPALEAGALVPAGCLVLLGDNPNASHDSRHRGYYRSDSVLGVVVRPRRTTSSGSRS
ncbi:signal peptidase I [Kribbella amoyensis]|uniref:Signal peptidase I n=1 Tax=Kribbella amoyensis TaxID=996641 RepID=A0A561BUF0_9ACTN|nr:S26 family signal peptidase [Kribbella amoyensis]TWD82534.1 signal peptidase I [Kribbella amoyensis]